jgi:hypothetical protein
LRLIGFAENPLLQKPVCSAGASPSHLEPLAGRLKSVVRLSQTERENSKAMSLIEINWSPGLRQLRQFGVLCLIAIPLIGWLWGASSAVLGLLVGVGGAMATTAWVRPRWLRPVFVGWMIAAAPIGMIFGELSMLLIYFGVFLPIGILFRLLRRDTLQLKMNRNQETYWQSKTEPHDLASYYRRF